MFGWLRKLAASKLSWPVPLLVVPLRIERRAGGAQHVWRVLFQAAQARLHREAEHAGVPGKIAGLQILLGKFARRLLDETLHGECARTERLTPLDVAERRIRFRGCDAEGHQAAGCGQLHRVSAGLPERIQILDQVIGRQHQQRAVVPVFRAGPTGSPGRSQAPCCGLRFKQ